MTDIGIVRAHVDRDGRLIEADPALAALNERAGGTLGQPLAVPPLASLVRLTGRLGVLISRSVTVADGDHDVDLWVRLEPEATGVRLALCGWRERQPWRPAVTTGAPGFDTADWGWETDAAMRLTGIALDAGERFGFDASALLGQPLTRLFRLDEDAVGDLPILGALALRQGFDAQRAAVRASGRAVAIAAAARYDRAGSFAGYVGRVHAIEPPAPVDTTMTDAFTHRLGRVLRSPLSRIIANADSINAQTDGPLRQDYVDYAADIATAGRHLLGLIDDLVDLQAVERADFTVAAEPLDLADVARRAAGLLTVRAADAGVAIERPGPGDSLSASGEFRRALQVLVNLVGNAVRYAPRGTSVSLRAERIGDRAVVTVGDQGKGIAPEDQVRIFDKFARVDTSEPGGSGLGLYIARRLARAMGGDLMVESAAGEGAQFRFALPVSASPGTPRDQDQR